VVSGVRRMNEVNARRARLVPKWVTVVGGRGYTVSACNQPTRSTQPCIPPGSLSRVPASARAVRAEKLQLAAFNRVISSTSFNSTYYCITVMLYYLSRPQNVNRVKEMFTDITAFILSYSTCEDVPTCELE